MNKIKKVLSRNAFPPGRPTLNATAWAWRREMTVAGSQAGNQGLEREVVLLTASFKQQRTGDHVEEVRDWHAGAWGPRQRDRTRWL